MANNPQAQYSPRKREDKLIQFDSVRNLPTIVFTKQVGKTPMKSFVAQVIGETLDVLAHDIDMSKKTLNVVLTRANTGQTHGHIRVQATRLNPTANLEDMELMLNLGPMKNAKEDNELIKTLMHETIHYVQYQAGILKGDVVNNFRTWHYTWNLTRATELTRRAQGDRCIIKDARPITPMHSDRVEVIDRPSNSRGDYNYARYLCQPHERQAWTQVLGLAHQLYPQALDTCRESARTAYKARTPRGARVFK